MVCERVVLICWEVEMVDVTDCLTPRVLLSAVYCNQYKNDEIWHVNDVMYIEYHKIKCIS